METSAFDQQFNKVFTEGVTDIGFFVQNTSSITYEALIKEATEFQEIIRTRKVVMIDGVD